MPADPDVAGGIAALVAVRRAVPSRTASACPSTWAGDVLIAGLVALVLPLVEGRSHGWPEWTGVSLLASPALLVA